MEGSTSQISAPLAGGPLLGRISLPLFEAKGWFRFLGVVSILEGLLDALFIVGLIIAWLPIWMGILLFQAAGDAERGHLKADGAMLESSNRRLKTYFILRGITILLEIAVALIMIFFIGTLGILRLIG